MKKEEDERAMEDARFEVVYLLEGIRNSA